MAALRNSPKPPARNIQRGSRILKVTGAAVGGGPGWNVIQSASSTGSTGTAHTATFTTANITAGSKITVFVALSAGSAVTCSSVTDAASNNWTKIGAVVNGNNEASIWALDVPAGDVGTKPAITATSSVSCGASVVIQEVSGLAAGNTTAMCDGSPATGTVQTSLSYSTGAAGEYLVSLLADAGASATFVKASGWTLDASSVNASANCNCCVQYKSSAGGSETNGWTGGSGTLLQVEVAFLLGAAAPAGLPDLVMAPMTGA